MILVVRKMKARKVIEILISINLFLGRFKNNNLLLKRKSSSIKILHQPPRIRTRNKTPYVYFTPS